MGYLKLVVNNKKKIEFFFNKNELKKILNLYAQMVSGGIWKDYSLNITKYEISFCVYKRTAEFPLYKITKNLDPKYKNEKYFVKDKNNNLIKKSSNIENLLKNTNWEKLKLVNEN